MKKTEMIRRSPSSNKIVITPKSTTQNSNKKTDTTLSDKATKILLKEYRIKDGQK